MTHGMDRRPFAVRFEGAGGALREAHRRAALTRLMFQHFSLLWPDKTRWPDWAMFGKDGGPIVEIILEAQQAGVLVPTAKGPRPADTAAQRYLQGGWLEEFAALALVDAGCRDVRYSQQVSWVAEVDGSRHFNEIDALGTFRGRPVLVSCKAVAHGKLETRYGNDNLFDALLELSYWNTHFADGNGVPVFLTTADFFDEGRGAFRSPKLVERADVLGISVLPVDFGSFDRVVARLGAILAASDGQDDIVAKRG